MPLFLLLNTKCATAVGELEPLSIMPIDTMYGIEVDSSALIG